MPKYASVQDVKDFSKLAYSDFSYNGDDAFQELINKALDLAEAYIDDSCRVPSGFFAAGGYSATEYLDWATPFVISTYKPITAMTSVSYDSTGYGTAPSYTTLTNDEDYIWWSDGRVYIFGITPSKVEKSIKLVYTAGYTTVPTSIRAAATEIASNSLHALLQRKVAPAIDMIDVQIPRPASMKVSDVVKEYIAPYRRHF